MKFNYCPILGLRHYTEKPVINKFLRKQRRHNYPFSIVLIKKRK